MGQEIRRAARGRIRRRGRCSRRRGQGSLVVLVARDDPLDTYLVHHPQALLDLGFTPEDGLTVDKLILGILAAVLLLLAALSAALFVDRTEDSIAKDAIATD